MSEKKKEMTQEREAKILDRATEIFGASDFAKLARSSAHKLSKAAYEYASKLAAGGDVTAEEEALRKSVADMSVWLKIFELLVGDATEEEIAALEDVETMTLETVNALYDPIKRVHDEIIAEAEAEDTKAAGSPD